MEKSCPTCGSQNINSTTNMRRAAEPYGPTVDYPMVEDLCNDCGDSGYFTAENDESMGAAIQKSAAASVELMMDKLSEEGISSAYFERALRLPVRTVSRWKTGKVSASGLALIRLVRTYKWLLEVSDSNFDQGVAAREAIVAAANLLGRGIEENTTAREYDLQRNGDVVTYSGSFRVRSIFPVPLPTIPGTTFELLRQE